MAYDQEKLRIAIDKKLRGAGMTNEEIGLLQAYNKSQVSPQRSSPVSNGPSFTEIENQRAKMFGNSSAPTAQQYFAASQSLGNGTYRPASNNYKAIGANPNQLTDRIHSIQDPNGYSASNAADVDSRISSLESTVSSLQSRVTVLETLLSGLSRRTVHICDSGTDKTMTIVSTTPV